MIEYPPFVASDAFSMQAFNTKLKNICDYVFCPQIVVTAPTGSTVTCSLAGGGGYNLTTTEVNGTWTFNIPKYGTWNVSVVTDETTTLREFVVDSVGIYEFNTAKIPYFYFEEKTSKGTATWSVNDYGQIIMNTTGANGDTDYNSVKTFVCNKDKQPLVPNVGDVFVMSFSVDFTSNGFNGNAFQKKSNFGEGTQQTIVTRQSVEDYSYTVKEEDVANNSVFEIVSTARSSGYCNMTLTKFTLNGNPFVLLN